jgi:glycogen(starch) synthase
MNIALFASAFHPHLGGVEELCRQLAHAFIADGHPTIVVTNQWPPMLPAEETFEGIPVYRLPMRVPGGPVKARVTYLLTASGLRRRLFEILRRHQTDLLHVQCVSTNGYYALLAKRELGLPLVVTAQGERTMDAEQIYQRSPFMNDLLRQLLREADRVTACSRNTLDDIEGFYGQPLGDRASVVYNGINLAEFDDQPTPPPPARPFILGIGRHVPQKGFDVLLRAFARAELPAHDLVLAGDGPERPRLMELARELGVEGRVRFPGKADRATAVALFKGCDFFVLPSRQEPMGIVNLEAMAAGKPVIASRVGGVPEIVADGETGILVEPENPDALSAVIRRLAGDGSLKRRLGAAGRRRAEGFGWRVIGDGYRLLYRTLLERSGAECPISSSPATLLPRGAAR